MNVKIFTLISVFVFVGGLVMGGIWMNGSDTPARPVDQSIAGGPGGTGGCC